MMHAFSEIILRSCKLYRQKRIYLFRFLYFCTTVVCIFEFYNREDSQSANQMTAEFAKRQILGAMIK